MKEINEIIQNFPEMKGMSFLIRKTHLAPSIENKAHHCEISEHWNEQNILKAARNKGRSHKASGVWVH